MLNDLDPIICAVWDYVITAKESEIMSFPLEFDHIDECDISQSAKYLIGFWLNKGVSAPRKSPSAWIRQKIRPNSAWGEVIRHRIASQQKHIRHWKVTNGSFDAIEDQAATWFIDPPYCSAAGRQYRFNKVNYDALGEWCRNRSGQVIVCESDGAQWLEFEPFVMAKVMEGKTGGKKLSEVIYSRAG
jgi:hypothetical protein